MVKSSSWNDEILTSTPKRLSSSSLRHTSPPPSLVSDRSSTSSNSSKTRQRLSYSQVKLRDPSSLIDLDQSDDGNTTTVSILHDFDPLNETNNEEEEEEEEIYWSSQRSNFSESFYDNNDPFSYMEQQVSHLLVCSYFVLIYVFRRSSQEGSKRLMTTVWTARSLPSSPGG